MSSSTPSTLSFVTSLTSATSVTFMTSVASVTFALLVLFPTSSSSSAASDDVCVIDDVEVHAVFAVDASRSVIDTDFNTGMRFVANFTKFIGHVNSSYPAKLGIFQFAAKPEDMLPFQTPDNWEHAAFRLTIHSRTEDNMVTNTERALKHMNFIFTQRSLNQDSNHTIVRVGFVLTDGQATNKENLLAEIDKLKKMNVTLYGIGVGTPCEERKTQDCVNVTEVELIAGSENRTFLAEQYGNLESIQRDLFEKLCEDIRSSILEYIGIAVGSLVGIIVGVVVAIIVLYAIQDIVRKRLILDQLAAGAAALKGKDADNMNPLYKNPVTTVSP